MPLKPQTVLDGISHFSFFISCFLFLSFLSLFLYPDNLFATVDRSAISLDASNYSHGPSRAFSYFAKMNHLSLDDYTEIRDRVKKGQTLTAILEPHGVSRAAIFEAAAAARNVFDVRTIRSGRWYTILRMRNGDEALQYFIYETSPEKYVVFDFTGPIKVYAGHNKIQLKSRHVRGEVSTTLQTLLDDLHVPSDIVSQLERLFGHRLHMDRLQKGDRVQVVYEEKYLRDKQVGTGHLMAASIETDEGGYQAFRYTVDGRSGYYDEDGKSLEKSFLKEALKYRKITSGFSNRRFHPVKRRYQSHPGIDYAAPRGTPVKSVGDGIVIFKGYCRSAGNYVKIKHPGVGISEYLHFSRFHPSVKKGAAVSKGQVIGYVGSSGYATGPHLDLRFMIDGRYVDYSKLSLPDGMPIVETEKKRFLKHVAMIESRWLDPGTMVSMTDSSGDGYDPLGEIINFPDFPFQNAVLPSDIEVFSISETPQFGPGAYDFFLSDMPN